MVAAGAFSGVDPCRNGGGAGAGRETTVGNSFTFLLMEIFSFFSYFPESAPGCMLSITP